MAKRHPVLQRSRWRPASSRNPLLLRCPLREGEGRAHGPEAANLPALHQRLTPELDASNVIDAAAQARAREKAAGLEKREWITAPGPCRYAEVYWLALGA